MYDVGYYRRPTLVEPLYERFGLFRPDQYTAACYLYGLPVWHPDEATRRFEDGTCITRKPGRIVSIGCGEGQLEAWLEQQGHEVVGVDPSLGARHLYRGSCLMGHYDGTGDTVLFVESLEHLSDDVRDDIWQRIPTGARIVIVNWPDEHPIDPDATGWDHVTRVDDALFDRLAEGHRVIVRRGSHLVLER